MIFNVHNVTLVAARGGSAAQDAATAISCDWWWRNINNHSL